MDISPVRGSGQMQEARSGYRPATRGCPGADRQREAREESHQAPFCREKSPVRERNWLQDVSRGNQLADGGLQSALKTVEGLQAVSSERLQLKLTSCLAEVHAAVEEAAVNRQLQLLEE
jgi:hypothetical protein